MKIQKNYFWCLNRYNIIGGYIGESGHGIFLSHVGNEAEGGGDNSALHHDGTGAG